MRSIWCIIVLMITLPVSEPLLAQVSPYSISPQWRFGAQSGLSFPSGSYPTSGAPTSTPAASNAGVASVEGSTSISDTTGAVAVYTNTMIVYNKSNANIRDLAADGTCGGSAIAGGVMVPDPASPGDTYYLFVAGDISGGSCQNVGSHYYKFKKNGAGIAQFLSGPNLLIGNTIDESMVSATDGKGNYWLFTHDKASAVFYRWKIDASGVTALSNTTIGAASGGNSSSMKISPCQDKIAWYGGGALAVYNFDKTTGAIGTLIRSWSDNTFKYGLEFSPDEKTLYVAGQGSTVEYYTISSAAARTTLTGGPSSWSMQLGPDGKIYTSGGTGSSTVGVINDPNNPTTTTFSTIANAGTTFRGLSNIAWLSPDAPKIKAVVSNCTVDFSYIFKNYFKDNVSIQPGSESWDFGDASAAGTGSTPTHVYPTGTHTYTVTLTFKDASCGADWSATTTVNTSCIVAPVSLISFTGLKNDEGSKLLWSTASEVNNDYFDVQRSEDGIHFYSIGTVKGHGSTSSASSYSFDDRGFNSIIYYRLAQHDIDGKITYSTIITITPENSSPVISPNPFTNNFTISFSGKNVEIKVLDMLGRIVQKRTMEENTYSIVLGDELNKGSYIISVNTDTENYYYKVIKE
jgi:hypothetical protein